MNHRQQLNNIFDNYKKRMDELFDRHMRTPAPPRQPWWRFSLVLLGLVAVIIIAIDVLERLLGQ
jgi:hypothetical protein